MLSHRFATIPQSLETCLFMQKIGSFLNPSHWAVDGSWEVPQTCKGFGFSHPLIRTCCCLTRPLSNWAFGNFSKSLRNCEKMPPGVCITLPHTLPVSQLPSTLGETILNDSISVFAVESVLERAGMSCSAAAEKQLLARISVLWWKSSYFQKIKICS